MQHAQWIGSGAIFLTFILWAVLRPRSLLVTLVATSIAVGFAVLVIVILGGFLFFSPGHNILEPAHRWASHGLLVAIWIGWLATLAAAIRTLFRLIRF